MSQHIQAAGNADIPLGSLPAPDIRRRGPQIPILARAAIVAACWLPFVAAMMFSLPRFAPVFERLRELGALPTLTEWMLYFGQMNDALFGLPLLLLVPILLIADQGATKLARTEAWAATLYGYWLVAVVVCGIIAFLLFLAALLLPVYTFPPAVVR